MASVVPNVSICFYVIFSSRLCESPESTAIAVRKSAHFERPPRCNFLEVRKLHRSPQICRLLRAVLFPRMRLPHNTVRPRQPWERISMKANEIPYGVAALSSAPAWRPLSGRAPCGK
ncbi:hypothetical protein AzCIB_0186 [Azoarcus sp. CIB]|nr:hypothetical protein AzCIB_0186 [Azoarcus sp. CIB]